MKKLSKQQAHQEIENFFQNLKNKKPKDIKKIKRLATKHNLKLGSLRKKFCKKCYSTNLKVKGIKGGVKTIDCRNCGYIFRWKIK